MGKLNPQYMRKRDSSLKAKPFATPPYLMGTVPNLLESLSYSLVQANESVANGLERVTAMPYCMLNSSMTSWDKNPSL